MNLLKLCTESYSKSGIAVDDRLVSEFGPEMALFRADTIAKNHEGQPTIERVRV